MIGDIRYRLSRWRANPRKWDISYIASRVLGLAGAAFNSEKATDLNANLLVPPIESEYIEILFDPKFRDSVLQVKDFTCLDFARLANIWMLVKMAGPGVFLEVGSYRGGTALHICNAMEQAGSPFYCFDPFETGGFEKMNEWENTFKPTDFMDTLYESVVKLLSSQPFAKAVRGFFPKAAEDLNLRDIAFCHLDVDMYDATMRSLEFLTPRLAKRGLIVIDDFGHRETPGVSKAVSEFVAAHPAFLAIPMFPCQAVLLSKSLW